MANKRLLKIVKLSSYSNFPAKVYPEDKTQPCLKIPSFVGIILYHES